MQSRETDFILFNLYEKKKLNLFVCIIKKIKQEMLKKAYFILIACLLVKFSATSSICSAKNNTKCTYRISRLDENEYLIVKNILNNLLSRHWNITLEWLMFKPETKELKMCDQVLIIKLILYLN